MALLKAPPRAAFLLAALPLLSACNIVTDGAPIWDMTWNVPSRSTSISVNTLLPSGVSAPSGTTFQATVSAIPAVVRTLGTDCPQCAQANGLTVPKPAFTSTGTASATLPSSITSATLVNDTIVVTIANGFNFDPIRPGPAGNVGSIRLTATSGTTTLGTTTLSGSAFAIPAGGTSTPIKLPIAGTVTSTGIVVTATIDSPAGDPVVMDASRQITITSTVKGSSSGSVLISGATVNLGAGQTVSAAPTNIDLSGIDSSVAKRVTGGSLFLTLTNPFTVTGNLTMTITGGSSPVTKTVALAAGTSTVRVDLTGAEMQRILGSNNQLTFGGTVSGTTAVTPGQVVAVASRLQLTLCTESSSANTCQ